MRYAVSNAGRSIRQLGEDQSPGGGELLFVGDAPGNPFDEFDSGLLIDAGVVRVKTPAEMQSTAIAFARQRLVDALSDGPEHAKLLRAAVLTLIDALNAERATINAILTAVDDAASLAALKTAVAAIPDLATITKANAVNAMNAKITAGEADS